MRFIPVGDIVLNVEAVLPPGRPVIVFINSLGTDLRMWDDVVERLDGSFGVVRYDKRGHGLSEVGTTPYKIEDHARDLAGILDHLGVKQAVICGISVGGMISLALSEMRPDLVRGMILSNTAHKIGTAEAWNGRIDAIKAGGIASIVETILDRWFLANFKSERSAAHRIYRRMLLRSDQAGYIATCEALRDGDFTETARKVKVPTLCIAGDGDLSVPPELTKSMAELIPNARFEVVKAAGHLPAIEQPQDFAPLIRQFMTQIDIRTPAEDGKHAQGMATRRSVLGEAWVDRAEANKTPFDSYFQHFITETAWCGLWSRPGFTRRERSIVTIALLAALHHFEEMSGHIKATVRTGASKDDIAEALMHVAIYGGIPTANHAFSVAKKTYQEMESGQ
ncbi:MAG TPA: 3-oxoadipate enol-lactonase [Stellaceae bacterium]|jgi:3-oxoadipate enol-lactonase/4-carboxymuconolactone decarboxylase|nr:3-oxoadipate enol-lactonase [Stellaceae bacterium]